MNIVFVVPTKDRPNDLRNLLASLAQQTAPIGGVIVVDSSRELQSTLPEEFPSLSITYVGGHKPSAAGQRNTGIGLVPRQTDLIGLVDDDMVIAPDAVEKVLAFWRTGPPELGGTAFNVLNQPVNRAQWLKRSKLCRWLGLYMPGPGQVARSGWHTVADTVSTDTWADWLMSGAAIWRREVFADQAFDPFFTGYSYLEDLDFSYSVSRRWRLAIVAGAHCWHYPSPSGRISPYEFGKIEVRNRLYFVRKHNLSVWRCYAGLAIRSLMTMAASTLTLNAGLLVRACGNLTGTTDAIGISRWTKP